MLSIRTALSIQAHPDKGLAAMLHAKHPDIYKDDNHKPEMALAVAPMEALCSFQKVYSILENLRSCPELVELVGADAVAALSAAAEKVAPLSVPASRGARCRILRRSRCAAPAAAGASLDERLAEGARRRGLVSAPLPSVAPPGSPPAPETPPPDGGAGVPAARRARAAPPRRASGNRGRRCSRVPRLLNADTEAVKVQLNILLRRIAATSKMMRAPTSSRCAPRAPRSSPPLNPPLSHAPTTARAAPPAMPGDVGVFCVYLLNYARLKPGSALPRLRRTRLSGECVECMATSDNVVRAGLTPKFKDVSTLCGMLTYIDGPPRFVTPAPLGPNVTRYETPVDEFIVDRVELRVGERASLPPSPGVSVLLILDGGAQLEETAADPEGGPAASSLLHTVGAGQIFMACADTLITLYANVGKTAMAFRATQKPPPAS